MTSVGLTPIGGRKSRNPRPPETPSAFFARNTPGAGRVCAVCGTQLAQSTGAGRPRKYCHPCAAPATRRKWREGHPDAVAAYNALRRERYAAEVGRPVRPYRRPASASADTTP